MDQEIKQEIGKVNDTLRTHAEQIKALQDAQMVLQNDQKRLAEMSERRFDSMDEKMRDMKEDMRSEINRIDDNAEERNKGLVQTLEKYKESTDNKLYQAAQAVPLWITVFITIGFTVLASIITWLVARR